MGQLNSQQLIQVAKQFKIAARAINDFQISNWDSLSDDQFNKLNKAERDILVFVQDLIAQSVVILAEDSEALIEKIKQSTSRIETSLKIIKNINKVIEIITASVFLASALASQNPSAILLSFQGLEKILDE